MSPDPYDLFDDVSIRVGDGSKAVYLIIMQVVSIAISVGHRDGQSTVGILKTPHEIVTFVIDCQQGSEILLRLSLSPDPYAP